MSKRIIIVHGWGKSPKTDWFPWAKEELEKKGFEVLVPEMPETNWPKIEPWVETLVKAVGRAGEEVILVGHSIGCQAVLRFLETLPENQKIGKAILVAPWFTLTPETTEEKEDAEIADPWLNTSLNFDKVKSKANSFTAILSDNDPFIPLEENKKIFEEKLGAEVIIKENQGHFDEEVGIKKLPLLLKYILD